jgi:hypothetical protein
MFDSDVRMQIQIYEMIMHVVRIKNLQLRTTDKKLCFTQILTVVNVSRLDELKESQSFKYVR